MSWEPSHDDLKFEIRRLDLASGEWLVIEFLELRQGDLFRAFWRGEQVSPDTGDPVESELDTCLVVSERALRSSRDLNDRDMGHCIEAEYGTLEALMEKNRQ